ncbi:MAG TPA: L,D-transpeptidase [Ktedonobacterales bacterium]|nr:L,D-transpeptidase [Ktedonobacterales bacterium]
MLRMPRARAGISIATFLLLASLLLIACGGNGTRLGAQANIPPTGTTTPYLPPTVVPATPTITATATHPPITPPPPPPPPTPPPGPNPVGGVPNIGGQLILVSLSQQWLWAYQDHRLYFRTPVTTGMPQLATPDGMFYIHYKETNVTFYSPWPYGSPYYYPPEHINYAMYFADTGYFIHDAPWRPVFGPGTNYPHTDPDGVQRTGSHGCVEVPTPAGAWIYNWAWNGATLDIYGTASTGPAPTPTPTTPTPTPTPKPTPTPTSPPAPTATPTAALAPRDSAS